MTFKQPYDQKDGNTCLRHYSSENNFTPFTKNKTKIQLPARVRSVSQ